MTHITIKKEKLEQVLAALEKCQDALAEELAAWDIDPLLHHVLESHDLCIPAIAAVKAALEQPTQQEPVAVVETQGGYPDESRHEAIWLVPYRALKDGDKLYTSPPQEQPAQQDSCCCGVGVSLQMISGGATEEGYLGRVTLLIDGKYVDYVKAQPPQENT